MILVLLQVEVSDAVLRTNMATFIDVFFWLSLVFLSGSIGTRILANHSCYPRPDHSTVAFHLLSTVVGSNSQPSGWLRAGFTGYHAAIADVFVVRVHVLRCQVVNRAVTIALATVLAPHSAAGYQ